MERSATKWALWVAALAPTFSLALVYGFVAVARVELGTWPQPYHPDPKDVSTILTDLVALGMTLPVGAGLALALVLLVRRRRGWTDATDRIAGLIFVVSALVWFTLLRVDPGQFVYWLAD